jgi:cell division protein FtsB
MPLYRARLTFVAAVGLASALLVLELPISEMLHQNAALGSVESQLAKVDARNAALTGDIASLRQSSTVASIAHAEYGLVRSGEHAFALLPTGGAPASAVASGLDEPTIPDVDLVVPSADPFGVAGTSAASRRADGKRAAGSIWSRTLDRLEFWRWAF